MTQHIFVGEGVPTVIPASDSAHYRDELTGNQYVAVGTSSADDWRLSARAAGGTLQALEPGEYSIGQDIGAVRALVSGGDILLILTPAAVRGGTTFELFAVDAAGNGGRLILRGAAGNTLAPEVSSVSGWNFESGDSGEGNELRLSSTPNYMGLWARVTVVDGLVFLQQVSLIENQGS